MDSSRSLRRLFQQKNCTFEGRENFEKKRLSFFEVRKDHVTYFKVIVEKNEAKLWIITLRMYVHM
jgi:hypothetical protein